MDLQERILNIFKQPQLAGLATITEEGKPWVRYVMIMSGEDLTLRCATFINARKVAHIKHNPEVHLTCGITDPQIMLPYLQILGQATLSTAPEQRHSFWSDMLAPIFNGPDDPRYGVLTIIPYCIEYWSPGTHEPEVWTAKS
jgi:general stress protein 26